MSFWMFPTGKACCLAVAITVGGCTAFGPTTIAPDRFDYNLAIAQSAKSQMLLNLVRLRYLDVPVFLRISSVVTQYTYEGEAGIEGRRGYDAAPNLLTARANLGYAERPTISYVPLADRDFTLRMLSTFEADAIFSLSEAGWPIDLVLKIGVERINNVRNLSFAVVPPPGEIDLRRQIDKNLEDARAYQRLITLILTLAARGAIGTRPSDESGDKIHLLVFRPDGTTETDALIGELKSQLGLDPARDVFRFAPRIATRKPNEIGIQTRSLLAMMQFLSKGVEVPEVYSDQSIIVEYFGGIDPETRRALVPMTIRSSVEPPSRAHVAIQYLGYWYYIDQSDFSSKRAFSMLVFLFNLQSTGAIMQGPVLTLPAGG